MVFAGNHNTGDETLQLYQLAYLIKVNIQLKNNYMSVNSKPTASQLIYEYLCEFS